MSGPTAAASLAFIGQGRIASHLFGNGIFTEFAEVLRVLKVLQRIALEFETHVVFADAAVHSAQGRADTGQGGRHRRTPSGREPETAGFYRFHHRCGKAGRARSFHGGIREPYCRSAIGAALHWGKKRVGNEVVDVAASCATGAVA